MMKKAFRVILTTLLALALVIGGGIYLVYSLLKPDPFDQERWFNHPAERVEMVGHLLSKVQLKGMTRDEIIALLGEQEEEIYFKEQNNLVYYLGDERGFMSIDSEWLVIWFDGENRVTDYEIKTD
jgi:hypothetical protein